MQQSLYKRSLTINEDVKNTSFDYKYSLLKKTNSPYLFQNNILATFLDGVSEIMNNNIEAVKRIRIHNNITVNKDETKIN